MISQKRKVYGHYHGLLMSLWTKFNIQSYLKWRRRWHPTPVLLPGKPHGRRSLVGCSPWGLWELDTTQWHHFRFSLSCIGEGHGNPLQCSCLENPRDGGAWWAVVYGVAQSRTRLKRLSSSSSSNDWLILILELFLNYTVASINHELCGLSYCCSVAKPCLTLWTPWTAARQAPLSFTISQSLQIHVCWVSDAIQPSHPLLPPFPFAFSLSQHQGLLQWVGSLHQVAKVITFPHLAPTPKFPIAIIYKKWYSILPMTLCHKPQACRRY